jgi:hypothetical protein
VREIVAMDGRQLATAANLSSPGWPQHYANGDLLATNSSSLASANSIQFLDRDGCPTDANLMGPLVRMDPQGHRLLAPFDAFKFPASDMVFFRAVVSSCVAECRPATCGGGTGGPSSGSGLEGAEMAPAAYGDLFSPTPSDEIVATTRNMPTAANQRPHQSASTLATESATMPATSASTTMSPPSTSTSTMTTTTTTMTTTTAAAAATTSAASTMATQAKGASTLAPYEPSRTTKLHNQHPQGEQFSSLDLLTTVPGFNVGQQVSADRQQQSAEAGRDRGGAATTSAFNSAETTDATTTTTSTTQAPTSSARSSPAAAGADSAPLDDGQPNGLVAGGANQADQSDHSMTINMTNNHNLGRPSPRPMTTTTTTRAEGVPSLYDNDLHAGGAGEQQPLLSSQSSTSGQQERRPAPAKLDPLTAQERQAILELLSGHEKSGLFSSVVGQQQSSASLVDEQIITSGLMKLYPILESFRHGNSRARGLAAAAATDAAANQTARGVLQQIRALVSDQYNQLDSDRHDTTGAGPTTQQQLTGTGGNNQLLSKIKRSPDEFVSMPAPSQEFVELINRTLIDYIIAEELKSTLLTQMLIDEARKTVVPTEPEGDFAEQLRTNRKEGRNLGHSTTDDNELQSREFPYELLDKFFRSLNWPIGKSVRVPGAKGSGLTFEQVGRLVKARFDRELANKIQHLLKLLNDSKASSGQQQMAGPRNKRQANEEELRKNSSYVYISEPQFFDATQPDGVNFFKGHVELYHTNELHRIKRLAPPLEEFDSHHQQRNNQLAEPSYEVEEMIVQSIKIVDRIQFEDEIKKVQHQPNALARDRRRPPSKETNLPQANRRIGWRKSLPDAPSGRQEDQPIESRLSAISILLVAMCFIFIQVAMVLLCLINWNNQRQRQTRRSLFAAPTVPFKNVDSSTISSASITYSDCSNYR